MISFHYDYMNINKIGNNFALSAFQTKLLKTSNECSTLNYKHINMILRYTYAHTQTIKLSFVIISKVIKML